MQLRRNTCIHTVMQVGKSRRKLSNKQSVPIITRCLLYMVFLSMSRNCLRERRVQNDCSSRSSRYSLALHRRRRTSSWQSIIMWYVRLGVSQQSSQPNAAGLHMAGRDRDACSAEKARMGTRSLSNDDTQLRFYTHATLPSKILDHTEADVFDAQ